MSAHDYLMLGVAVFWLATGGLVLTLALRRRTQRRRLRI